MRQRTALHATPAGRFRHEAVVAGRDSPREQVRRAKVVLAAAAEGRGTAAIGRRVGLSRPSVRRWRERFVGEGGAGLLRDVSRGPGRAPHRARAFELSRDPAFVAKLRRVGGLYMRRRRRQELPRFLAAVEAAVPAGKPVHAVLDGRGTHERPKVLARPARQPRWTFRVVPTSGSWLNAVEAFLAEPASRRPQRGSFHPLAAPREAVDRSVEEHGRDPRPSAWTADPEVVVEGVARARRAAAATSAGAG